MENQQISPEPGYPVFPERLPGPLPDVGKYRVRFAATQAELDAVQKLRFEVFNVFNRTNVVGQSIDRGFNPGVELDGPRESATTVIATGEPGATFGQASAVRDPRQVQLGVKLTF